MANITNENQFRQWLEKEGRARFALVLALRVALRVLPIVDAPESRSRLTLSVFRCAFIAWAACRWPAPEMMQAAVRAAIITRGDAHDATTHGAAIPRADAAFAAAAAANTYIVRVADAAAHAARAPFGGEAAYAANAVAHAADAAAHAARAPFGGEAAFAANSVFAAEAAEAAVNAIWLSISQDTDRIDGMNEVSALEAMRSDRLWLSFAEGPIISRWTALNRVLNDIGDDWSVWSEWYGRRFTGEARGFEGLSVAEDEELCVAIALKDNAFWERDAPLVNGDIRKMLDLARAKPPAQDVSAETFGVGEDGLIGRGTQAAGDHLGVAPAQIDLYSEFQKSFASLNSCSANEKGESLKAQCDDLCEVLTPSVDEVNYHLFWPRFHRLRITLKRHRTAKVSKDYSPYLLDEDVALLLQDVVQNGNILIVNQSKLIDKEKQAQGPDLDSDDRAFANIRTLIIQSAADPDVTNGDAAKDVAIAVEATDPPTDGVEGILGKAEGKKVQRNFMIVLMEKLKPSLKVAKDAALSEGAQKSTDLIIENHDSIIEFFATQGEAAVDWISSLFGP